MGKRRRYRKRKGNGETPLIPVDWWSPLPLWQDKTPCAPASYYAWHVTREEVRAYLNSCYGNIYARFRYLTDRQTDGTENHMLLGAFVGAGAYLNITWLDLRTNRKWDESVRMEGIPERPWTLVSEMEVKDIY